MPKFTIVLKPQAFIDSTLIASDVPEDNGLKHCDGIICHITGNSTYEVDTIIQDMEFIDIKLVETQPDGSAIYVSPKWIKAAYIDSTKVVIKKANLIGDKYFKFLDNSFFDYSTKTLIDKLPVCNCCGAPLTIDSKLCPKCVDKFTKLNDYNFKPSLTFHGTQLAADSEHPIHYGLEFEYSINKPSQLAELVFSNQQALYIKSDSSIKGAGQIAAEIVTHPHTYSALMSPDSLVHRISKLDVSESEAHNGIHIHVSRTAFKDNKHYSLFYFLLNSNKQFIEFIGNRELTEFCEHNIYGRVFTKENKVNNGERRSVVNEQNKDTIEIRFFNSTTNINHIYSYIQFVDSLIKYTKYHKKQVSLLKWAAYVSKYKSKYSALHSRILDYKHELAGSVTFKPPVAFPFNFDILSDLKNIDEISTASETYKVDNTATVTIYSKGIIEFRSTESAWYTLQLSEIISIKLLKDA